MSGLCGEHYSGLPSPPTILNTSPQSTSITLTWSQPSGDVVDSYQISYSYTIRVCGNLVMNAANISVANSSRMYSLTGLEENSDYTIFLTAINVNGSSPTVNTAIRTTLAGSYILNSLWRSQYLLDSSLCSSG